MGGMYFFIMTKFFPPTKTMQLRSNITGFRQEEREPLPLAWERMKECIRNCPSHGMEDWLIIYLFYNALNPVSKSMLDTAAGGTFMASKLLKPRICLTIRKITMPNGM